MRLQGLVFISFVVTLDILHLEWFLGWFPRRKPTLLSLSYGAWSCPKRRLASLCGHIVFKRSRSGPSPFWALLSVSKSSEAASNLSQKHIVWVGKCNLEKCLDLVQIAIRIRCNQYYFVELQRISCIITIRIMTIQDPRIFVLIFLLTFFMYVSGILYIEHLEALVQVSHSVHGAEGTKYNSHVFTLTSLDFRWVSTKKPAVTRKMTWFPFENDLIPQMTLWFQDLLRWLFGKEGKSVDKMGEGEDGDPGYESIMDTTGISWWNVNPIYVPLASEVVIGVDEFKSLVTQNAMSSLSQGRGCFRYWNNACVPTNLALKYMMPVWCAGQPGQTRDSSKRGRTENLPRFIFRGRDIICKLQPISEIHGFNSLVNPYDRGWICESVFTRSFDTENTKKVSLAVDTTNRFSQKRGKCTVLGGDMSSKKPQVALTDDCLEDVHMCHVVAARILYIEVMLVVLQLYRHTFQHIPIKFRPHLRYLCIHLSFLALFSFFSSLANWEWLACCFAKLSWTSSLWTRRSRSAPKVLQQQCHLAIC